MAKRHALGRQLAILGLSTLVVVAVVVETASLAAKRRTDAETLDRVQADAFQQLETIRERMLQSVRAVPDGSANPIDVSNEWLAPLLASTANKNEAYAYAMVVSQGGTIVAHSDATQVNRRLPERIRGQVAVARGRDRRTNEVEAWFGEDRLVNYSMPVMLNDSQAATAHIGVSIPALTQHQADRRWASDKVLWLTALLCLLVVTAAGGVGWLIIARARRKDEEAARRDHLAEVGKLAGGLVHEIRNPLNAMRMQIAVMRGKLKRLEGEEAEHAATQLSRLESEVLRLQSLATSFLAYGRPPTDKLQEFDAADVVRDLAEFLESDFEDAGLAIKLEIDPQLDGATMIMDRGKLRQVLLNLAENARHAMSEGGTLTLGLTHDPNGPLRLTVQDTGCGIPRDSLKNIFDAFFSTKDDGNGLGLSIVRQIVESSGGTINVQSEIDRGTCFSICFPRTTKAQRRGLQPARPATPSEVTA